MGVCQNINPPTFGSLSEILLDRLNGDIDNSFKGMAYYLLEKVVEKGVNKLMPGNVGPSSKDVGKYLINKFTGHGEGGKLLQPDFDLGKSIINQGAGAGLKTTVLEQTLDAASENEQKKK